ncbi:hypothetical protein, partial [Staphylococcus aureus]|uniref:hypothetical protein n=1 Tax=Staphylococcus aureus TaxID=1280 RepID=UPI0039BEA41B
LHFFYIQNQKIGQMKIFPSVRFIIEPSKLAHTSHPLYFTKQKRHLAMYIAQAKCPSNLNALSFL